MKEKFQSDEVKPEKERKSKPSPVNAKILIPGILIILAIFVAGISHFKSPFKSEMG